MGLASCFIQCDEVWYCQHILKCGRFLVTKYTETDCAITKFLKAKDSSKAYENCKVLKIPLILYTPTYAYFHYILRENMESIYYIEMFKKCLKRKDFSSLFKGIPFQPKRSFPWYTNPCLEGI